MQRELPLDPAAPEPAPQKPAPRPRRPRTPRKPAPPARTDMRLVVWVALLIFLADQVLKYWVVHILQLDRVRAIDVLPPWLNLRMAWNQGVNFGLMASDTDVTKWVLITVALVIVTWVWIWIWRSGAGRFARVAAGLLIGGALGNVVDRLLYGAVADFLNMSLPGWQNPYSFNVADIAIFAGAIGLVLVPQPRERQKAAARPAAKPARKPRAGAASDNPRDGSGKSG